MKSGSQKTTSLKKVGHSYLDKNSGLICMIRCHSCDRENWAPAVASGNCAWCGFNPNLKVVKDFNKDLKKIIKSK